MEGWLVNPKRVQRIWRQEGLKVPKKQPKRSRLWLNDGSCIRLRAERKDHVWSYDFLYHRTHEGRPFRLLAVVDEYTRDRQGRTPLDHARQRGYAEMIALLEKSQKR